MMPMEPYPSLKHFLGGYFHQDCYDAGDTDEDIVRDFVDTTWDYQRFGLIADIHRILHQHGNDLLKALDQAFAPDIVIGETDEEAKAWLLNVVRWIEERRAAKDQT